MFDLRAPAVEASDDPRSLPEVVALRERASPGVLTMVGVCVDSDANVEEVADHARGQGPAIPIVLDRSGDLTRRFGVTVTPEAFVPVG